MNAAAVVAKSEGVDCAVLENLGLAYSIARRYRHRRTAGFDLDDLRQESIIGLQRAARKFDPARGVKFSSHAVWWIRQAITRSIADQARMIRAPSHVIEMSNTIWRTSQKLAQALGREPRLDEIAAEIGIPIEKLRGILGHVQHPVSLETPIGDDDSSTLGDIIGAAEAECTAADLADRVALREAIETALGALKPREREVLRLRFGLGDGEPLILAETGARMGCTGEYVRQLESAALAKLRKIARGKALAAWLDGA